MVQYGTDADGRRATAEERYTELSIKRDAYLREARACAELTIPRLIPPEGVDQGEELVTCAQSDGAKCVNGLATKITLGSVPPNIPIVRFETDEILEGDLDAQVDDPETKSQLDKVARESRKNLDRVSRETLKATAIYGHRSKIYEGTKHLVCGGSVLYWFLDDKKNYGKIRTIPLSRHAVLRDSLGFPLEIIIRDGLSAANLPPRLKAILNSTKTQEELLREASKVKTDAVTTTNYAIYTYACWDPEIEKYRFHQEFQSTVVDGSEALYTIDNFPLVALRFNSSDGEDYGRGHVEEHRGVLMAIEALAQAETAKAIAISEHRLLVGAGSTARARDIMNSPIGAPLDAEPGSIAPLEHGQSGGLADIRESKRGLQRELGIAFLDNMAVQRDAERVTAEEFRTLTLALDLTLGGLHAALAAEFLPQYARFLLRILKNDGRITAEQLKALDGEGIQPRLVTGLDALGRNYEAQQFFEAQKVISDLVTPAEYAKRVNVDALADKVNGYYGIETKGIYKTEAQLAAQAAAAQQAAENEAAVGPMIAGASQIAASQQRAA